MQQKQFKNNFCNYIFFNTNIHDSHNVDSSCGTQLKISHMTCTHLSQNPKVLCAYLNHQTRIFKPLLFK